jgi:hypothetical protein
VTGSFLVGSPRLVQKVAKWVPFVYTSFEATGEDFQSKPIEFFKFWGFEDLRLRVWTPVSLLDLQVNSELFTMVSGVRQGCLLSEIIFHSLLACWMRF